MLTRSLLILWGGCVLASLESEAHESSERALEAVEPRIRAIYEAGEFRPKRARTRWAEEGAGYWIRERGPGGGDAFWVKYDLESGSRVVADPPPDENAARSPNGARVLETREGNLGARDEKSGEWIPLTQHEPDSAIRVGDAVWSPDGERALYIESDYSAVRLRSVLVPGDPSYPTVREDRFARVGGQIPKLRVGVVDADGGAPFWLPIADTDEDFYLGEVDWAGNSKEVFVEKLSRFRDVRTFYLIHLDSGEVQTIFHEEDPAWVVASTAKNRGIEWIDSGAAFVVLSERDGWRHAYKVPRNGGKPTLLTPGNYDIIEKIHVDEVGRWFYFYASPENGTQRYLYRVSLDGAGAAERLTPENQPGWHTYDLSPDAGWAFHTYSTFDEPPVTQLIRLPGHEIVRTLEDNQELRRKMKTRLSHPTEFLELEIGEGVRMDAWLIKPSDFDASKKYPVFVYVYGEPHAQTVLDRWGSSMADYHRAVADLGYLVVSIDNRGTPAPKGAAWRRSIFGSLGPLSTEEQAEGIQALAALKPYVDLTRVGIWGWSGGGSNTLNAMFRRPDVYSMGIAVVPKPQPHLYNAWFQEIYMRDRKVNADGYERAAPINFAEGLEGDLLIIHGSGETNTHLQIVEGLVDRLIELGKPFDYMVYPNRNHGIREGEGTTVHMRMRMLRYLLNHLPPGARN